MVVSVILGLLELIGFETLDILFLMPILYFNYFFFDYVFLLLDESILAFKIYKPSILLLLL